MKQTLSGRNSIVLWLSLAITAGLFSAVSYYVAVVRPATLTREAGTQMVSDCRNLVDAGRWDEAERICNDALLQAPPDLTNEVSVLLQKAKQGWLDYYYARGRHLLDAGEPELALLELDKVFAREPGYPGVAEQRRLALLALPPTPTVTLTPIPSATPTASQTATAMPPSTPTARDTATLTPTEIPTSLPTATPAAVKSFIPVSIGAVANASTQEGYVSPPLGSIWLGGALFDLPTGANSVTTQAETISHFPTQINLFGLDISSVSTVYLLLTGGLTRREFEGRKVGEVNLLFDAGESYSTPLIPGRNLREWKIYGDQNVSTISDPNMQEIWRTGNTHDDGAGVIDMLTIAIPPPLQSLPLRSIQIIDTSTDSVNSMNPAINLIGVTVFGTK